MRTLIIPLVLSLCVACNASCASSPAVQRQEQRAVACLPLHLPLIIACHTPMPGDAVAEAICIAVQVTALASCWTSSPPAPPPALASSPSSGSEVAR